MAAGISLTLGYFLFGDLAHFFEFALTPGFGFNGFCLISHISTGRGIGFRGFGGCFGFFGLTLQAFLQSAISGRAFSIGQVIACLGLIEISRCWCGVGLGRGRLLGGGLADTAGLALANDFNLYAPCFGPGRRGAARRRGGRGGSGISNPAKREFTATKTQGLFLVRFVTHQ